MFRCPVFLGAACLTAVSAWSRHNDAGMDMNSVPRARRGAIRFLGRKLRTFTVPDGRNSSHPVPDARIAGEDMGGLSGQRLQPPEPLVQGEIREPRRSAGRVQPFVAQQVFHPAEHEVKLAFLMRKTGRNLLHDRRRVSPHLGAVPEEGLRQGVAVHPGDSASKSEFLVLL